jgi:hypothetical protein
MLMGMLEVYVLVSPLSYKMTGEMALYPINIYMKSGITITMIPRKAMEVPLI